MKVRKLMHLFMALSLIFAISCDDNEFPSSENSITKFGINGLDSEINETNNTITVTVPYGTDVTKLKPTIQLSEKASVTPSADKETDFTNPVKYVVTAEDGSVREYTVSVKVADSNEKKITSFVINHISGTIDEANKKISVVMPYGTDITKLSPVVTISSKSTLSPESGKELDFTNPVEYTVSAQDGSTQKYTVEVSFGKNSSKAITGFSINDIKGSIDEENKKITIALPFGYDLTKLTPKVEVSESASVTPISGAQVDLSSPVEYTVSAEDGTTVKYTVNVILGKNTQKEIVAFSVNNVKGVIDEENKKISLSLPAGTDATKLTPQMTVSAGATVSPSADTQIDFTNPVEYTVTAEDGTSAKYTVTVNVEKYTGKAITKFTVNGVDATIDETNKSISFTLPTGTDVTALKPSLTVSQCADVSPASGAQVDFTNPVEYTVTAEDGSTAKYTATANVTKRSDKAITKFAVNGVDATIDEASKTVTYTLPAGADITQVQPVINVSAGATVNPTSNTTMDFTNPVAYTVTAEDGSTVKYTVTIKSHVLSSEKQILKFTINGVEGVINQQWHDVKLTLPAGTDLTALQPVMVLSAGATVNPASGSTVDFTLGQQFFVTAEDGTEEMYTIYVKADFDLKITGVSKTTLNQGEMFQIQGQFAAYYQNNTVKLISGSNSYTLGLAYSSTASQLVSQVPQDIPAGNYTLQVDAEGKTGSYSTPIVIAAVSKPVITSVSPENINADDMIVTITGTGFGDSSDTDVSVYSYENGYWGYFFDRTPISVTSTSITLKIGHNDFFSSTEKIRFKVSVNGAESEYSNSIIITP